MKLSFILCRKWDKHLLQQRNVTTIKTIWLRNPRLHFRDLLLGWMLAGQQSDSFQTEVIWHCLKVGWGNQRVSLYGDALCSWGRSLLPSHADTNADLAFSVRWATRKKLIDWGFSLFPMVLHRLFLLGGGEFIRSGNFKSPALAIALGMNKGVY